MSNADFDRRKEELLTRVDLTELVDALGLERKGKDARCPNHNDTGRPNLHIYKDRVHCFACDFNVDAFGLVEKVRGLDFVGSFDFLAARYGLPLIGDYRKSGKEKGKKQGLGYGSKGSESTIYPKPAKLPDGPSPYLDAQVVDLKILGHDPEGELPVDFPTFAEAWAYREDVCKNDATLWKDQETGLFRVIRGEEGKTQAVALESPPRAPRKPETTSAPATKPSLRVRAFTDLLGFTVPASTTEAGRWMTDEKGISPATLDAFGVVWLTDVQAAYADLRSRYGVDDLTKVGLLNDKGNSPFAYHRLLFPFYWKGQPVDIQGRKVKAIKNERFRNTGGTNPVPYNADALLAARETGEPVFLCEGATDTLTLAQSGRLAVGIVGTGGFKAAWLPYFDGLRVFLALDSDKSGQDAAKEITKTFIDAGQPAPRVVRLPDGVKDINEFFRGK